MRLVPCDPEASYLLTKIGGGPYCSGEAMPLMYDALGAADVQILRDWIATGASSAAVTGASCPDPCSE